MHFHQVDASILLTANVPSAKKIIVHGPQGMPRVTRNFIQIPPDLVTLRFSFLGPEDGGIPSQFPLNEDVQFCQILQEAQDFFGIEEEDEKEYFLVDHRTSK